MKTKYQTEDQVEIEQQLVAVCQRYAILDLYVFGSRSKEIAGRVQGRLPVPDPDGADVDIGILPAQPREWTPVKKVKLTQELEDLFDVERVDLVLLPEADPFLALDIIRGELLYTRDPNQQARYELYVLRRAGDLLPFQKIRTRMILEEGAR